MAPSKIGKAFGAVKDRTSIGLAKVSSSNSISDLEVAIVKATRHEEQPADEKHIREILSLTCYSRGYISSCVNTLSRRLNKTRNWTVALKTLMLIHRLLAEGDPAYEQEIFFATRRGTRLLNMSDFRDKRSNSSAWDFSSFVRTYALYLDEQLELRMQGRRRSNPSISIVGEEFEEVEEEPNNSWGPPTGTRTSTSSVTKTPKTPVREMKTEQIFTRAQHLQNLIDRFLACRPTGAARNNRVVIVALYAIVKDSFQIYTDLTDIIAILIDRFLELEINECAKVHDIFTRAAKQFDELDAFYSWSKAIGIARSSEYPDVERISPKKLQLMDEFITERSLSTKKGYKDEDVQYEVQEEPEIAEEQDLNSIKALPPPEGFCETELVVEEQEPEIVKEEEPVKGEEEQDVDFLNLRDGNNTNSGEDQENKLALALFDGAGATTTAEPAWEAFPDDSPGGWETALVVTTSNLNNHTPKLGGGFDSLLLNGMYQQHAAATINAALHATGSASSVAFGSTGKPGSTMLALPAPTVSSSTSNDINNKSTFNVVNADPFAASLAVAPPTYVQMSEMEKKQRLLMEEQLMWQQYARDGMQGHIALKKSCQTNPYGMGGYAQSY
ncbi:putative clathrin assembly protein At1g03050 [Papaver somniferum]|uniref:putative clathrin assembly protein At1g03050 n=1 Tax=Papaver somniferum TaxID=3469 RepID=UPI000E6F8ED4|nr:putative clathrin assembly protein At1g03050 [Papaver somniferum]XP_026455094.1 putative clathrin assembly protein At1g03050 [Papaver somniferum]XP_026455095.1 putative clathrin assembly protein At1g03050 [Papaver somniferum]